LISRKKNTSETEKERKLQLKDSDNVTRTWSELWKQFWTRSIVSGKNSSIIERTDMFK